MNRMTSDSYFEMDMHQFALNQVYIGEGGRAWYVEDPERECGVCDLIRTVAETLSVELPVLSDEDLSDLLADWAQYGAEEPEGVLAILYRALWAMAELRAKLKQYEDTGLEPEEITAIKHTFMGREVAKITELDGVSIQQLQKLAQAEKDGRLVAEPPNIPLTLEELREMDGEPVWSSYYQRWGLVSVEVDGKWAGIPFFLYIKDGVKWEKNIMQWQLALYRCKPGVADDGNDPLR